MNENQPAFVAGVTSGSDLILTGYQTADYEVDLLIINFKEKGIWEDRG
jgi:hypothetical protein